MRAALLLGLVLSACASPSLIAPSPSPTRDPGSFMVTALLELSGPRAALGTAQRNALALWSDQQQGRAGQHLRWTAIDVATSEARVIIELRRASEEQGADAVIIGVPVSTYSDVFLRAVELAKVPVLLTLPAPAPPVRGGRWLFALAPPMERVDRLVSADLALRGIDDLPFRLAPREADAIRDPAQLPGTRAIRLDGTPQSYALLADVLRRAQPVPIAYFSYLTDPNDLGDLGNPSLNSLWPGSRNVVGGSPDGQTRAQRDFVRTHMDRHGPPATWAATAFDALAIVAAAVERSAGVPPRSATALREVIRDRLEETSTAGIATTYRFSPSNHVGPMESDLALLRWGGTFVTVAR